LGIGDSSPPTGDRASSQENREWRIGEILNQRCGAVKKRLTTERRDDEKCEDQMGKRPKIIIAFITSEKRFVQLKSSTIL
jgi:hypothetical protein